MPETRSKLRRLKTAMLLPLLSLLALSMSLTGCTNSVNTRIQFISPKLQSAELSCLDRPHGQLPLDATNGVVSQRIVDVDEAGEDCRQKLNVVRLKIDIFNEVVAEMNAAKEKASKKE